MTVRVPFWKLESVGNDFVLVHLKDIEGLKGALTADAFLQQLAVQASDRHFGIGSDGLLVVGTEGIDARFSTDTALWRKIRLRMFNPDGTEDFCGNGIRCAMLHGASQEWSGPPFVTVLHYGHEIVGQEFDPVKRKEGGNREGVFRFRLDGASYAPADIPTNLGKELFREEVELPEGRYVLSALSTGTAHTIIPVAELPDDEEFHRVSPALEHHPMFPERTSVIWVQETEPMKLKIRIWERGAGETMGCGTGSTAAALDYMRHTSIGGTVEVLNPGGPLRIDAKDWQSQPLLYGTANANFRGEFHFRVNPA